MPEGLRAETDAEILRRRNYELTILNAIAQALNSSVDLDQALHLKIADALLEEASDSEMAREAVQRALTLTRPKLEEACRQPTRRRLKGDISGTNSATCA